MTAKPATPSQPIHALLAQRWSRRAFDAQRTLTPEQIIALCEAARWAPSSNNEQPWRFVLCDRARDEPAWRVALNLDSAVEPVARAAKVPKMGEKIVELS